MAEVTASIAATKRFTRCQFATIRLGFESKPCYDLQDVHDCDRRIIG